MPANAKAALTDEQKAVLRFDEQPEYLARVGSGLLAEPVQIANTRFATVTSFVQFFVMLLTLTIFADLKQLSPSYRKAAADLGANGIRTFVYVVLPLTLPGIMVGAFLTFVLAIGDYVTPQVLGGNNELAMPQLTMMRDRPARRFSVGLRTGADPDGVGDARLFRLRPLAQARRA